jgi:predicted DNA-binding protein
LQGLGVAATNVEDRIFSSLGGGKKVESHFENHKNVCQAGVLFSLPALLSQGLLKAETIYCDVEKGYYKLVHILLVLAFMALSRIKNPEQLKTCNPGELGKIIGIDRIPETKCLRERIDFICKQGKAQEYAKELSTKWIEDENCFYFYVDGHVRVYHGDKAKLTKKYVSRQKLCLQGTTEFWVNNQEGMPFMVFTGELNEKLKDIIKEKIVPELIEQTKSLINQASLDADPQLPRFTLIFDREAYEPAFFKWLWDTYRIAVITYRKNVKDKWDEKDFKSIDTTVICNIVTMQVCEKEVELSDMKMREIRKLGESGHQTSIITTNPKLTTELIAGKMFSRWSQENFFRYMLSDFDLDHIVQYGVQEIDGERKIVNPLYKHLSYQIKKLREKQSRLKNKLFNIVEQNLDGTIEELRKVLYKQVQIQETIKEYDTQLELKLTERKTQPTHIKMKELGIEQQYNKLKSESKLFINTIKMIAYRAETALVGLIATDYSKSDNEGRMFIKEILKKEADLEPDYQNNKLNVKLHSMSTPIKNEIVKKLCDTLNESETVFPGTNLTMVFKTHAPN